MFFKNLFFCCLITFHGLPLTAQVQWQLTKEKDGIKIYTANNNDSNIKSIKAVATFNGNCQKLISIFLDIEKQEQWVYATKKAYLIKKVAEKELIYYVETTLPWPVKNRYAAIRMKIDQNTSGNMVTISTAAVPDVIPMQNEKVRVTHFIGNWKVKSVGKDKILITYFLDIDPGGSMPAWLINLFITKGPYETFYNLSELLKG